MYRAWQMNGAGLPRNCRGSKRGSHSWFLLLRTERLLPFRKCLIISDINSLVGRDWAHLSAIKLILIRCYRSEKKEEIVSIIFVSLKDIRVRITDFTQFALNLTCKRTPNPFPCSKGIVLQHRTLPPVLHTYLWFFAITAGMIHLRFVLNMKLFSFFSFFKPLMLFSA